MMEFLSTISPKLGWIITGGMLLVFVYIGITNWRSQSKDAKTEQNGTDLKANIVDLKFDEYQELNNHLTAAVTVKYIVKGEEVIAKRGIAFPFIEKDQFFSGAEVNIRVDNETGKHFYFSDYKTY
ncbi:hypothetical protein IAE49_12225 [Kosakonia sp. S58]|uniref:hypothetical protein n=1 Tax=unclassified Kosakonia TaxID=2632876 RepID=UPI0019080FC2|nr:MULTISPECIES: hypothetical protein [unclassified Kosakonia]MBK0079359.1 hypothetical protein [Kosakonia sp. S57]MBK0087000.1 hypothetical protein [Kosakonia sp. S58]